MATSLGLPVSRLIRVNVSLSALAAQGQNLTTLLILGSSPVIGVTERWRQYSSITDVASDFGTSAPEYLAAALWFEQVPAPSTLAIGRWAKTAAAGQLVGGVNSHTLADFQAVSNGGFDITIDGAAPLKTGGLTFAGAANMNAVASTIQTALISKATCVWDAANSRFVIASTTTGPTSSVSLLRPPTAVGSPTDISGLLGGTTATGATAGSGVATETALAAVQLFDQMFGQQWYAVTVLGLTDPATADPDVSAIAGYIEATTNYHYYGATTMNAAALNQVTNDTASILQAAGYRRTAIQYSSSNPYAVVSLLSRIMTTDYNGNNTTITLMYKQEPGIAAEVINTGQADILQSKNCNVFVLYNNSTAIIQYGVSSSGDYIDTIMGTASFAVDEQTALYNSLYTSPTKISQDDSGMHILGSAIETVALRYVANGFIGPGTWLSAGFGALKQNQFLDKGYYLWIPPVAGQSQADRAARKSVPFQLAAKLRGAVHEADLALIINV